MTWRRATILILVALVVRVTYWRFAVPGYVPLSDAGQYWEIASNFAHGDGLSMAFPALETHPTAFRPPLYPILLGSWWWIFGTSVGAGQVLNLIIGIGVVLLTEVLTRRLAGPLAGMVAGIAVAVCLPLAFNDVTLLAEPLSLLLLLAALIFLFDRRVVPAALFIGLLMLTRPSAQGLVVIFGLWVWWRIGWKRALGFVGIIVLVLTPWLARNWIQLGSPIMYSSNGFNIAATYSTQSQGAGDFLDPVTEHSFDDPSIRLSQFNETDWNHRLQTIGLDGLRSNPRYVLHVLRKNAGMWLEFDQQRSRIAEFLDGRNMTVRHWASFEFYVFTVAGLAGLALNWRRREVLLLLAISAYFTLASLFFVAPPRLRAPFDLINCIGLGLLVAWWEARRRAKGAMPSPDGSEFEDDTAAREIT